MCNSAIVLLLKQIFSLTKFLVRLRLTLSCNGILNVFQFAGKRCSALLIAQHTAQQCTGPEFRQREEIVNANATVESASSPFCHLPFSFQNRGGIEKPSFVSAHYISAVIAPNESPVCGFFQQGTVTGPVNWTWLGSP